MPADLRYVNSSPCIVVIEDDSNILELLRDLLEYEGLRVIALSHPRLLEHLDSRAEIDIFLIDMMLPSVTGLDVAARLRAGRFPDTPMIALSASQSLLDAALDSGMFQSAVAKPFDVRDLVSCIRLCRPEACNVRV